MIGTLFFYLTVMLICMGLSYWSKIKKTKIGIYLAYFILMLVSVFRFDIGNDYDHYVRFINHLAFQLKFNIQVPLFSDESVEPLMYFLTYVFRNTTYPYVWVIGFQSIIVLFFLYKAFDDNDSHVIGILILFISEMLFVNWDQLRQGVAIAILIYAIKYIKEENFYKYLLFILLGISAHYSTLLVVPFYFVNKIKPRKYIYIAIIMALALSNAATNYYDLVYMNLIAPLPYFDTKDTSSALVQIMSENYKIRIVFYSLVWSTIIYFLPIKERVLSNFLFIGAIIFIIANGALNVTRISFFFIFSTVISIPIVLKNPKAKIIMSVMIFGLFLFFVRDVLTNTNTRGCIPYESIFSDKFNNQIYRHDY